MWAEITRLCATRLRLMGAAHGAECVIVKTSATATFAGGLPCIVAPHVHQEVLRTSPPSFEICQASGRLLVAPRVLTGRWGEGYLVI
ncbi:MAG: hypothetical protein Q7O66_13845, partial [Dehalococcoidia bacterium]|nr:hypothetical protein [Dehalococcoidia bacterium]